MGIKIGQVWKRNYGEDNIYNGELEIRGFVDNQFVILFTSESGKSRYDMAFEKFLLSDIKDGSMTLVKDVPEVKKEKIRNLFNFLNFALKEGETMQKTWKTDVYGIAKQYGGSKIKKSDFDAIKHLTIEELVNKILS